MFLAQLYEFPKKHNSTKIPSGNNTDVNIVLKAPTSVLNPIFELDFGNSNPSHFNYCYIAQFRRYYFIEDWTYNGRLWEANCVVDALASWKPQIGNSNLYVLRSASEFDGNVIDSFYAAKANTLVYGKTLPQWTYNFSDPSGTGRISERDGYYVVGVLGRAFDYAAEGYYDDDYPSDTTPYVQSGIKYYVFNANEFRAFINVIYPLTGTLSSQIGQTFVNATAALFTNYSDYIVSIMWFPCFPPDFTFLGTEPLYVGFWSSGDYTGVKILRRFNRETYTTIEPYIPDTTRGKWCGLAPFARYQVYIPFFGLFDLPPELVVQNKKFRALVRISMITGAATLKIIPYDPTATETQIERMCMPIITASAQIGVPMSMGDIKNGLNLDLGSMIGLDQHRGDIARRTGVKNKDGVVEGIDAASAISSISGISLAAGAVQSATTFTGSVHGTAGGFTENESIGYVYTYFNNPVEEDNTHLGRPLCKNKKINTLSGYIKVLDGDIDLACTQQERDQIKNYLEGGFFYE